MDTEELYETAKRTGRNAVMGGLLIGMAALPFAFERSETAEKEPYQKAAVQDGVAVVQEELPETYNVPEDPSESATVPMTAVDFEDGVVWIEEGGTVTWKNQKGAHTVTSYSENNNKPRRIPDSAEGWDSGYVTGQGSTYSRTFEEEGVYDYFCLPHEGMGMVGTVIVGTPDDWEDSNALQPPQDELPSGAKKEIKKLNEEVREILES